MSVIFRKIRLAMNKISRVLDMILAIILIAVIVIALIFLKAPLLEYIASASDTEALLHFITYIINIVIVVELFKMLCSPGIETILEVMMFVIVRHMIVSETSAWENFLTVISVAIIIVVKKYVLDEKWPRRKPKDQNPDGAGSQTGQ